MKFGDIPSFKLIEDIYVNHLGYGYITYYDPESSSNAIKNCNGKSIWNNKIIEVKYLKKKRKNEYFRSSYFLNLFNYFTWKF